MEENESKTKVETGSASAELSEKTAKLKGTSGETQTEGATESPAEVLVEEQAEEALLSLESLDSIISEVDPDFSKGLNDIGPDEPDGIFSEGSELKYSLQDELDLWRHSLLRSYLQKIAPWLPRFSFGIKQWLAEKDLSGRTLRLKTLEFFKSLPKLILASIVQVKNALGAHVGAGASAFRSFSLFRKLGFIGLVVATIAALVFITRIAKHGLIKTEPLFLTSLEEWSQDTLVLQGSSKEMFFSSPRASQHVFLMKKMMANIRRSEGSGPNPMGAFEFFVEGTASDVMVEIKDREAEIEDLFLRTIEEMSYDRLDSGEGKQELNDRLRMELNQVLTKGLVRNVYLKTIILKP